MPFRAEDKLVDYSCGITDFVCKSVETMSNWAVDAINWLAELTLGGSHFSPDSDLWGATMAEAGRWFGLSIIVMVITGVIGLAVGAIRQSRELIGRTLVGILLSVPATLLAYLAVGEGLRVVDDVSDGILANLTDSSDGFAAVIQQLFGGMANFDGVLVAAGNPIGAMLLVIVFMAAGFVFIAVAMAFRDFALMVLIAFAPLAFVLLPAKGGGVWVKRWAAAVTAMALARPIILGCLSLVMLGASQLDSIWSNGGFSLAIGVLLTSFMPILIYSFFQFMGGGDGGDHVGSRGAGILAGKGRSVTQGTRSLFRGSGRSGSSGAAGAPGASRPTAGGGTVQRPAASGGTGQGSGTSQGTPQQRGTGSGAPGSGSGSRSAPGPGAAPQQPQGPGPAQPRVPRSPTTPPPSQPGPSTPPPPRPPSSPPPPAPRPSGPAQP